MAVSFQNVVDSVSQREENTPVLCRRTVLDDFRPHLEEALVRCAEKKKEVVLRKKGSASYVGE